MSTDTAPEVPPGSTAGDTVDDADNVRWFAELGLGDVAKIKTAAKVVNDAAAEQEKWFPAGSGPEAGKTQALAEMGKG